MDELIGKPKVQQWEYYRMDISNYTQGGNILLDDIGSIGWELISCIRIDEEVAFYIFKRPLP